MKCSHCGTELEIGARFCTECGAPVEPENVAPAQAETEPEGQTFQANPPEDRERLDGGEKLADSERPAGSKLPEGGRKKTIILIVVIVVAVLFLCCCGFCCFAYIGADDDSSETEVVTTEAFTEPDTTEAETTEVFTEPDTTEAETTEEVTEPETTEAETTASNSVYYSTNSKDTVKNGDSGVYAYKMDGQNYDQYYIIDFDEGYVYYFCDDGPYTTCERLKIDSGTLNTVVIVTYHAGDDTWQNGLYFSFKNRPDTLVMEDSDHFTYNFSTTNLQDALAIRDSKTITDY